MHRIKQQKEEDLFIFKYKRPANQQPIEQIGIDYRPRKINKIGDDQLSHYFSKMAFKEKPQFLLKKLNPEQLNLPKNYLCKPLLNKLHEDNIQRRQKFRQQIINTVRGIKSQGLKIIDITQEDFVDFNGIKIVYEKMVPLEEDYYVLQKNQGNNAKTSIFLPQEVEQILEDNKKENDELVQMDSEDSNRQDHPDYDYPEEQYYEGSSEQVIEGQDQASDQQLDEQQLYLRYLRRCKNNKDDDSDQQFYQCS